METISSPNKSILLVDDDVAVLRALAARCESLGLQVHTACDSLEAVALIRRLGRTLDLIMLDLNLPGTDGLTLCESLREDPRLHPLPVIMLTGHDSEENRIRCQAAGAFFVRKDVNAWLVLEPLIRNLLWGEKDSLPVPQVTYPGTTPIPEPSLNLKVLAVDDDEAIIRLLKARFEAAGCRFMSADSGMKGYRMAVEEAPDIILLDYKMPGGWGNFILGKLKSTPATCNIPVIILSGMTNVGVQRDVLRLGAECWVNKPFEFKELMKRVVKTIE